MELSFPRTFAPGSESSIGGTFTPWNFRPLELVLPRAKMTWKFHSPTRIISVELLLPGAKVRGNERSSYHEMLTPGNENVRELPLFQQQSYKKKLE